MRWKNREREIEWKWCGSTCCWCLIFVYDACWIEQYQYDNIKINALKRENAKHTQISNKSHKICMLSHTFHNCGCAFLINTAPDKINSVHKKIENFWVQPNKDRMIFDDTALFSLWIQAGHNKHNERRRRRQIHRRWHMKREKKQYRSLAPMKVGRKINRKNEVNCTGEGTQFICISLWHHTL